LKKFFIQSQGQRLGPCTLDEVRSLISGGWISTKNLGQYEGDNVWRPLASFPELNEGGSPSLVSVAPDSTKHKSRARFSYKPLFAVVVVLAIGGGIYFAKDRLAELLKQATAPKPKPAATNLAKPFPSEEGVASNSRQASERTNRVSEVTPVTNQLPTVTAPTNQAKTLASNSGAPAVSAIPTNSTVPSATAHSIVSAFDVQNAPFGQYDAQLIDQVRRRWIALMAEQDVAHGSTGKVTIEFQLNYQGQISGLKVVQTEVGDVPAYLCQRAIQECGPFSAWPPNLRSASKQLSRTIRFTFTY